MQLYVGLILRKQASGRIAQIVALDPRHAYLTWDDDGSQTRVQRQRFNRTGEWEQLVGYELEDIHTAIGKRPGYHAPR